VKEKGHLENRGIDAKVVLKWIILLEVAGVGMDCSQVSYARTAPLDVLFKLARLPSASEEGFCTMEDFIAYEY
jgi:hypothetical protein